MICSYIVHDLHVNTAVDVAVAKASPLHSSFKRVTQYSSSLPSPFTFA